MKTVPNIVTSIGEGPNALSYSSLLANCLSQTPEGGFTLATIKERLRVADVAEKAKGQPEIILEDADYHVAVNCIRSMRWNGMHPDLVKFAAAFGL